jgi:hypothetical protein
MVSKHKSKKRAVSHRFNKKKAKGNIQKYNQAKYVNVDLDTVSISIPVDPDNAENERQQLNEILSPVKPVKQRHIIKGIRLINFEYFWKFLIPIVLHTSYAKCNIDCLEVYAEKQYGLNTLLKIHCKMCNSTFKIYTCEDPFAHKKEKGKEMNEEQPPQYPGGLNFLAVLGITNIGSGYHHLVEFLACLNIPCFSVSLFAAHQKKLLKYWTTASEKTMRQSVAEEVKEAQERGEVTSCWRKIPLLTVIIDGCWAKRSYRINFSSLSGAVTIIGAYTKKVLWIG